MATEIKSTGLSLDELKERPEWKILSMKQQLFAETYIASSAIDGRYDAVLAVNTSYGVKSNKNALLLSYELLGNKKIQAVLDLHFGPASKDMFLNKLQRKLEKTLLKGKELTVAEKDSIKLLFAMRGWTVPEGVDLNTHGYVPVSQRPAEPETKAEGFKVGDIVEYDGAPTRITALDANGIATDGEPLEGAELEAWLAANKSTAGAQ